MSGLYHRPFAKWKEIQEQVISVFKALRKSAGFINKHIK